MHIDSARTRRVIKAIAARMTRDAALRDDLFQEAVIRLWSLQQRRPGQSKSWYLQGCKLHMLNYMNRGRSVDSPLHVTNCVSTNIDDLLHAGVSNEEIVENSETETSLESGICARDIIMVLNSRVNLMESDIISYLAQGFRMREIARTLGVSHVCVVKHRRNIAKIAIDLGICLERLTCPNSSKSSKAV